MEKLKMSVLAVAAIIGSATAFATHTKTVQTPPCSANPPGLECKDADFTDRCCIDANGATVYGPLQPI